MRELVDAHGFLITSLSIAKASIPRNTHHASGVFLRRSLDCAVIRTVHQLREEAGLDAHDTLYGVFEEGEPLYPGAGFKKKTHVQAKKRPRHPQCLSQSRPVTEL